MNTPQNEAPISSDYSELDVHTKLQVCTADAFLSAIRVISDDQIKMMREKDKNYQLPSSMTYGSITLNHGGSIYLVNVQHIDGPSFRL